MMSWQNKMEIAPMFVPEVEVAIRWIMSPGYLRSSCWTADEDPTPSSVPYEHSLVQCSKRVCGDESW